MACVLGGGEVQRATEALCRALKEARSIAARVGGLATLAKITEPVV
jgi:transcriptional regulator GlxA family with amidase domain